MNRPIVASLLLLTLLGLGACNDTAAPNVDTPDPPTVEAPDTAGSGAANNSDAVAEDYTVVPGRRVGQVTSSTSRQQLAAIYGEANLQDTEVHVGEGFMEPGTIVSLGNQPQFAVVWLDDSRSRPLMARDFSPNWKTPEGLGVGTPYATLQQTLGPFQLYGFGWDYGGTISLEGSQLDQYYGLLLLRLDPSETAMENHPEALQATMGDRLISSTDPNLAQLDIHVSGMVVYLNAPAE